MVTKRPEATVVNVMADPAGQAGIRTGSKGRDGITVKRSGSAPL